MMIIDCLLWEPTETLLITRRLRPNPSTLGFKLTEATRNADANLNLINIFNKSFLQAQPSSSHLALISLRLLIARFVAMFLRGIDLTMCA